MLQLVTEKTNYKALTVDILARTLWGEMCQEGFMSMEALASVILNRHKVSLNRGGYWWGDNIIAICQKPYQFACWNRASFNYKLLNKVDDSDEDFRIALQVADSAINGKIYDHTDGATHYHITKLKPSWAVNEVPTIIIENHSYYNLVQ